MKPRSFIRALGDCWDIVSTIWSRYETRTLTERELLHIVRPFTIGTDQPEQVAVKRMVDIGILSEFSRGGQGYLRIPRHSDTQPTLIRTPVPRSFGQAV
ncbi:hypothetical protein R0C70_20010, partial [Pseudomonas aeruginosa]|nr:hypothetical protein [Pseudomonas aeruginosa]